MHKRWWAVGAAAVALGLTFVLARWVDGRAPTPAECAERVAAAQKEVRTDRRWNERDLPGIGAYPSVSWQVRALGDPCSQAPGPTDWSYQGVVTMRPDDARALAAKYDWRPLDASAPADGPAAAWPDLRPLLPADARWLASTSYSRALTGRSGSLYLDPDRAVAFFVLQDR